MLKDAGRRAEYDELRQYRGASGGGFEPPPHWQGSSGFGAAGDAHFEGDFSDFFNSIFRGEDAGHGHRRQGMRGQDAEIELPVFLEELVSENSRRVDYQIPVYENGQIKNVKKSLDVKLPAGVRDGERIRLKGQGGSGQGEGADGDLYLHVRLVPHPMFDVEGHNLVVAVPIAPWEAALGTKVDVPTLSGKVRLTIAPNSQTGQRLRLKGKGLKTKTGTGDLYAVLKVVMPASGNDEVKALWQSLSDKTDFDPRAQWSS